MEGDFGGGGERGLWAHTLGVFFLGLFWGLFIGMVPHRGNTPPLTSVKFEFDSISRSRDRGIVLITTQMTIRTMS